MARTKTSNKSKKQTAANGKRKGKTTTVKAKVETSRRERKATTKIVAKVDAEQTDAAPVVRPDRPEVRQMVEDFRTLVASLIDGHDFRATKRTRHDSIAAAKKADRVMRLMLGVYMSADDCTELARSADDLFADMFARHKSVSRVKAKVEPVKSMRL